MQPPLPPGTVLHNRYRLTKTLGEGGFGRTYLAQDQDRFEELCVLKEYNPNVKGTYALNKSKELFKREAEMLYKIEHNQIPKFRATFEEKKRLFLVQDFVEGKSYRSLLNDRLQQNQTFTQKEIVEFLGQMLPVLAYIHEGIKEKTIIHRDISPDNIIRRDRDNLPVLIDFGAVKEIREATQIQDEVQGTTVGKLGYSPPEQLQTGKVDASSDLYALAATAVTLLTGRKPQDLLDQSTMIWQWKPLVPTLNLRFGQLLDRMLSYRAENRYQSAKEAHSALRSIEQLILAPPKRATTTVPRRSPPLRRPPAPRKVSFLGTLWNHPTTGKVIGGGFIVFVAAIVFKSMAPDPTLTAQPKPSPVPKAENPKSSQISQTNNCELPQNPQTYGIPLNGMLRETDSDHRTIEAHQTYEYTIYGETGQLLTVALNTTDVSMSVLNSNRQLIAIAPTGNLEWQSTLPSSGRYYIAIAPTNGTCTSNYKLEVTLMPGK